MDDPDDDTEPTSTLQDLWRDPGRIGVESLPQEITKLQRIRQITLPPTLFQHMPLRILQVYRQRAAMKSHPIAC